MVRSTLSSLTLMVGGVITVAAVATFAQAGDRTMLPEPLFSLHVFEQGSSKPIVHPMVCIREFRQPLGAIGDSLGLVIFGGGLPNGVLHLQIVAPGHLATDTTVVWPTAKEAKPMVIHLRLRQGPPVQPRCVVESA